MGADTITGVTHETPIGEVFPTGEVKTFDGSSTLQEIFSYASANTPDGVVITEAGVPYGIMTLKDIMRALQKSDNLHLPVKEFMSFPLRAFQATQKISEVLDSLNEVQLDHIVVLRQEKVVGVLDRRHLLSLCYSQLTPLIKHEYGMLHSILSMAEEGESGLIKLATTDALTGIGNRRMFEEIYQAHQTFGRRYEINMFLMMFDIDDFKKINDSFGHNVGDTVLKELTALVSRSIRQTDVFIRWGGDEFAILLRYSEPQKVVEIAQHICDRINAYDFEGIGNVSCSFGLTPIRYDEKLEMAVARADSALYRAKANGKNAVQIEMV